MAVIASESAIPGIGSHGPVFDAASTGSIQAWRRRDKQLDALAQENCKVFFLRTVVEIIRIGSDQSARHA